VRREPHLVIGWRQTISSVQAASSVASCSVTAAFTIGLRGTLAPPLVANVVDNYRTSRVVRHRPSRPGCEVQRGRVVTAAAMLASLSELYQTGVKP